MDLETSASERVRDVVRGVVADSAPEELPLVDGLFQFDDATVVRRLSGSGRRRDPLGFGVGEVVALATPVVWLALNQVAERVTDAALDGASRGVRGLLRRLLRRPAAPRTVPPLTREQLAEVRRRVVETGRQRGLSEERATELADAVAGRLALAEPGDTDQSESARP
ncbi:hypothetical protein [Peterkaempfera sp. SMS 1(5)a]|uniref:hypothetical protein n=1 Tax=Peterkaempfera podocarpi TaxID=3232308 RepID=UPI00367329A6